MLKKKENQKSNPAHPSLRQPREPKSLIKSCAPTSDGVHTKSFSLAATVRITALKKAVNKVLHINLVTWGFRGFGLQSTSGMEPF